MGVAWAPKTPGTPHFENREAQRFLALRSPDRGVLSQALGQIISQRAPQARISRLSVSVRQIHEALSTSVRLWRLRETA